MRWYHVIFVKQSYGKMAYLIYSALIFKSVTLLTPHAVVVFSQGCVAVAIESRHMP